MKPDEMKRYDLCDDGFDNFKMRQRKDGDYVEHKDALAAIEEARREERERALGWAKKFAAVSRAGYLHFRPLLEAIEQGRPLPTTPAGDENE